MNGPEHVGIGAAAAGVVVGVVHAVDVPMDLTTAATGAAVAGLGALAPDFDHPRSLIGNRIPATLLTIGIAMLVSPFAFRVFAAKGDMFAGVWQEALAHSGSWPKWGALLTAVSIFLLVTSFRVTATLEHRGPLHSMAAATAMTGFGMLACVVSGLSPFYGVLFGLGWATHLLADATTPTGLPYLFWPLGSAGVAQGSRLLLIPLVLIILLGLWSWYALGRTLLPSPNASTARSLSVPADSTTTTEATAPVEILGQVAPDVVAKLVEPENPVVERVGTNTSYTWVYLDQSTPDRVAVKRVVVTIDETGELVGVEYR